ncbi:hypothetical protein JKP88DRAFT_282464 [Tribonema minus]|uniref:Uncharacterized protein n=1 Tax=Tribonema minus TaxID=303371 RepID=A0A836C8D8_9STRA|nr:hypothetical protein JKP88DRAFT_282464 [Tribonema minus]
MHGSVIPLSATPIAFALLAPHCEVPVKFSLPSETFAAFGDGNAVGDASLSAAWWRTLRCSVPLSTVNAALLAMAYGDHADWGQQLHIRDAELKFTGTLAAAAAALQSA